MKNMRTQSFLLLLLLVPILSSGMTNGMEETPKPTLKPQYDDFAKLVGKGWIDEADRSYYTLIGVDKKATEETIKEATDPSAITWGITTRKPVKRAAVQEIINARRLLTENVNVREQYDTNLEQGHVTAKNIAIQKLTNLQKIEVKNKDLTDAVAYCNKIITELMSHGENNDYNVLALYDPAYNHSILELYRAMAQKYADNKDFKSAEETANKTISVIEELKKMTETTFIIYESSYPTGLAQKLKKEYLDMLNEEVKESFILSRAEYRKLRLQEKPSEPIIPVEMDDLMPSLAKLTRSLKSLETTIKK